MPELQDNKPGTIIAAFSCIGSVFIIFAAWAAWQIYEYRFYNENLIQSNCTLFPETLVAIGKGSCTESWPNVKSIDHVIKSKIGSKVGKRAPTYWETVSCIVSKLNVSSDSELDSGILLGETTINFRQEVRNCSICASDRMTSNSYETQLPPPRSPDCVDIYGAPVHTCNSFIASVLESEPSVSYGSFDYGSFACCYPGPASGNPTAVSAGEKQTFIKDGTLLKQLAVGLTCAGCCFFAIGLCIAKLCSLIPSEDDEEKETEELLDENENG